MRSWYFFRTLDVTLGDYGRVVGRSLWVKQCRARRLCFVVARCLTNKHDKWRKSFMIYLELSIRRGRKFVLKWWRLDSFPRPPLRPYTRDSISPYWWSRRDHHIYRSFCSLSFYLLYRLGRRWINNYNFFVWLLVSFFIDITSLCTNRTDGRDAPASWLTQQG